GALRADDNSAFGEHFDFVVYPKLHATWVVNEEPFWPFSWVDAFKVRAAWGSAGQQPDVFAAVRSYQSAPGEGTLTPRNAGNPNLKPERAEELELGVDAALWNGRLGLAFTYFNKRTRDAIVASQVAPSLGFPERQLENLGVVRTWGTELALDARLLDHPTFAWDLGVGLATNGSRIETLGGLPSVLVRGAQEHREGYPLAAFFQREIASAEVDPLGRVVNVVCAGGPDNNDQPLPCVQAPRLYGGQPTPRWQGSVRTTLTVLRNLRLYGLVDFKGGHTAVMGDILASYSNPVLNNTRVIHARSDTLLLAFFALNATVQSLKNPGVIDAGFAKLREVSLAYALPRAWAGRVGVGQATITAAARNLAFLWRAQKLAGGVKVMDPEVHRGDIESELSGLTLVPFPQYAQFLVTVRLSF
ncbi:MAG: TonB-dependent receptor, partial [Gemmatimonadetes bacterium]|nr:TonB-dependent receptor [Gemmatimonadota bacterium]